MMKFNKSERIQNYCYPTTLDFINDVIETILDEDNYESSVNIVSDINTTTELLEFIISSNLEQFNFDVQLVDIRDIGPQGPGGGRERAGRQRKAARVQRLR